MYTCIHICIFVCLCMRVCVCVCVCACICARFDNHVCVCVHVLLRMYMQNTQRYMHSYMCMYVYICVCMFDSTYYMQHVDDKSMGLKLEPKTYINAPWFIVNVYCMYVCMHVCMYVCVCMYVGVYTCVHVYHRPDSL